MTTFSEIFASDFATTILAITSAPLLIGLAAFAVSMGRRTDAALGGAFGGRGGKPRPGHRWDRHPARTLQHDRRGTRATRARSDAAPQAAEFCSTL